MENTPLQRLRAQRNLTLLEVAQAIGTDTGNLSRIESGAQKSINLATKLVEYFGRSAITEVEILYPERYPPKRKKAAA